MTTEANKALLRRYVAEVWHKGNTAALDDFLSPQYRATFPRRPHR